MATKISSSNFATQSDNVQENSQVLRKSFFELYKKNPKQLAGKSNKASRHIYL